MPKAKHILISNNQGCFTISTPNEHKVDGLVTGIIVNLMLAPLLLISFSLGLLLLYEGLLTEHSVLLIFLGILFSGGAFGLFRLFGSAQASFFPYKCYLEKQNNQCNLKRKLWIFSLPQRYIGTDIEVLCQPAYMRGDWGFSTFISSNKSKYMLTAPMVLSSSKNKAQQIAINEMSELETQTGISTKLIKW